MSTMTKAQMEAMIMELSKQLADVKKQADVKKLDEVEIKGQVKDGYLLLKMPVGEVWTETFEDKKGKEVALEYLFRTGKFNKSVPIIDLGGVAGFSCKLSVYRTKA